MSRIVETVVPARLGTGFRWLLGASWLGNLGDGLMLAAGPLLVASKTDDAFVVALAATVQWLPPLVFGLYWKRSTTQGAIASLAAGIGTWLLFFPQVSGLGEHFPGQLAGLLAGLAGMVLGSLAPQRLKNRHEAGRRVAGLKA